MTAGTQALKAAWRDFAITGIPSSGGNEPDKGEIRAALDTLALDIAAAAASTAGDGIEAIVEIVQPLVDQAETAASEAADSRDETVKYGATTGTTLSDTGLLYDASGGAVPRTGTDGRVFGMTYPSGVAGLNSYAGARVSADVRAQTGAKVRITLVVQQSATFTRNLDLALLVQTESGETPRAFDFSVVVDGDNRFVHFDYIVQGDELGFAPFLQSSASTTTASEEWFLIVGAALKFLESARVDATPGDLNVEQQINRAIASNLARISPTITVAQSGGDFTSISAALASINDASERRRYRIQIAKRTDGQRWSLSAEITWKDWVDLEGSGPDLVPISFRQANNASLTAIEQNSAFRVHHESIFRGLDIDVENARYVFHVDDPSQAGKTVFFDDCRVEHRGNAGARAYQTSIGADPNAVWASTSAVGMGTYADTTTTARGSYFKAPTQPFSFHNATSAQQGPSFVDLESNVFEATNPEPSVALQLNSQGSQQRDVCRLVGNKFIGLIAQEAPAFFGADPEWFIVGHGNVDVEFYGNAIRHQLTDFSA